MHTLKYEQKIPLSLKECWKFFSSPRNLQLLTPKHLDFSITCDVAENIYAGQIISYIIRPIARIPIEWITEITHVEHLSFFIDEQRIGPYKMWHHEHRFEAIEGGVLVQDRVYYRLPFGILGPVLHKIKVARDLESIFSYRQKKLIEMFGPYPHP